MFRTKFNPVYLATAAGGVLMLVFGASFSWSSPVLPKLLNNSTSPFGRELSLEEATWISSLVPLGATVGPFISGYVADKLGRKLTMIVLALPLVLGYLILVFGRTVELYYVARLIIGLAVGSAGVIFSYYIGEIAEKSVRGILTSVIATAVSFGFLLSYSLGPFVSIMVFNAALTAIPVLFLVLFSVFGMETPHYYVSKQKYDAARTVLQKIRGKRNHNEIDEELKEIQMKMKQENEGSFFDAIRSKGAIRGFIISISLFIFQQLSGINFISYYGQMIFQETGASLPPEICVIIIGAVQLVGSFIAPFIVDRFGRRITLMVSATGMIVAEVPLGVYIYLKDEGVDLSHISFVPIVTLVVFILTYNSGFGPLPYVILGEVFPTKIKAVSTSMVAAVGSCVGFLVAKYFDFFLSVVGFAQSFWIFAGCCFVGLLFSKFYLIETKGKSLQEIQDVLNS